MKSGEYSYDKKGVYNNNFNTMVKRIIIKDYTKKYAW